MFDSIFKPVRIVPFLAVVTAMTACAGAPKPSTELPKRTPAVIFSPTKIPAVVAASTRAPAATVTSLRPTVAPVATAKLKATGVPVPTATLVPKPTMAATVAVTASSALTNAARVGLPGAATLGIGDFKAGKILIGTGERALYVYKNDIAGKSSCYGDCALRWPPALTEAAPAAGLGVNGKLVGTLRRKDGKTQLTYNKMPLYYFAGDKAKGDVKGEALENAWFVVSADGKILKK